MYTNVHRHTHYVCIYPYVAHTIFMAGVSFRKFTRLGLGQSSPGMVQSEVPFGLTFLPWLYVQKHIHCIDIDIYIYIRMYMYMYSYIYIH